MTEFNGGNEEARNILNHITKRISDVRQGYYSQRNRDTEPLIDLYVGTVQFNAFRHINMMDGSISRKLNGEIEFLGCRVLRVATDSHLFVAVKN